jgi:hypothetical protein
MFCNDVIAMKLKLTLIHDIIKVKVGEVDRTLSSQRIYDECVYCYS